MRKLQTNICSLEGVWAELAETYVSFHQCVTLCMLIIHEVKISPHRLFVFHESHQNLLFHFFCLRGTNAFMNINRFNNNSITQRFWQAL